MAISSKIMIILAGLIFGALGALLVEWGNPGNMGICVACFYRDIAGALGLHRAGVVQYLRPEIMGFVLGAFISAYGFREFRARGGSSPMVRFFLGAFVMIGALVFLGCPTRALLRLAGGDLNGITAVAGLILGAVTGIFFLKQGFNLGRSSAIKTANGWIMPVAILGLLLLAILQPGFIFESESGPGSMHAALWISLLAGLGVGILAQRTRLCFVGGWRDLFLIKNTHLFGGIAGFFLGAFLLNLILGHVRWGFAGQPVAHTDHLWNFLGMVLVGLGSVLLGGCPLRQTILSGEGDTDAGMTVLGLFAGAAFAHNFLLASTPEGATDFGQIAVMVGLVFAMSVGFLMRDRIQ
ncbi:MAG TPA: YedE-related selenium metabolism membrane protein [Dehalococcoidia bacterium]|nr:YedE-related selenium metabolism membrane protein [Dehalococcoidia bacterium]